VYADERKDNNKDNNNTILLPLSVFLAAETHKEGRGEVVICFAWVEGIYPLRNYELGEDEGVEYLREGQDDENKEVHVADEVSIALLAVFLGAGDA